MIRSISGMAIALLAASVYAEPLARLPNSSQLTPGQIGQEFYVEPAEGVRQSVIFVGFNQAGVPLSFPLAAPEYRTTFRSAIAQCAANGSGWGMPTIEELRLLTPHAKARAVTYLPGSSWTSTLAPCAGCKAPTRYKLAYDINSSNVRNSYDHDLFKFYATCVYRAGD